MRRLLPLLLLFALSAHAQTFRHSEGQSCATGTSCTFTLATNPLAGSAMTVGITWGNLHTVTVTSVTDTQTDTYGNSSPVACTTTGAFGDFCGQIFVACNIKGGATAITVNFSGTAVGGAGLFTMTTGEFTGAASLCYDQSAGNNQTLSSSGSFTSPSVITTQAMEAVVGLGKIDNGSTTAGAGFTGMAFSVITVTMEYKNVTSTGSYSAAFNNGNSGPVVASVLTIIGGGAATPGAKRRHPPFIV